MRRYVGQPTKDYSPSPSTLHQSAFLPGGPTEKADPPISTPPPASYWQQSAQAQQSGQQQSGPQPQSRQLITPHFLNA